MQIVTFENELKKLVQNKTLPELQELRKFTEASKSILKASAYEETVRILDEALTQNLPPESL